MKKEDLRSMRNIAKNNIDIMKPNGLESDPAKGMEEEYGELLINYLRIIAILDKLLARIE